MRWQQNNCQKAIAAHRQKLTQRMEEIKMNAGGIISGILFIVGIGSIFISSGTTIYMLAGDALVALAGLSFVKFSK